MASGVALMSTCARCGGHLTDHHKCRGLVTNAAAWSADLLLGGALGAVAGEILIGQTLTTLTGEPFQIVGFGVGLCCGVPIARRLRRI